jgi:hypothetical protein
MDVIQAIDAKIGEVRTESLDMSVGEIIALHQQNELVIQPDFQRLFRWSWEQRSRLVESLLLDLPLPSIFVIEREDGVLELIDGLQRISSLIHFIDPGSLPQEPEALKLEGCDLVSELNGLIYEDLPLTLRLRLKRTGIRTVIIKRQSTQFLRYEMFKRLNTGGSKLSDQDIRNVNARMIGEGGADFYGKLLECASFGPFKETMELLPTSAFETRADEELVLRFFAAKNFRGEYRGNIGDWLDNYMEGILLRRLPFSHRDLGDFFAVFEVLAEKFGPYAFVKYRNGQPIGGVAPAYFEAVSIGAMGALNELRALSPQRAKQVLAAAVESDEFRSVTGPGANSFPKLQRRIQIIASALSEA